MAWSSLYSWAWPWTSDPPTPVLPEFWNRKLAWPHQVYMVPWIKPMTLGMIAKHSTNWVTLPSLQTHFKQAIKSRPLETQDISGGLKASVVGYGCSLTLEMENHGQVKMSVGTPKFSSFWICLFGKLRQPSALECPSPISSSFRSHTLLSNMIDCLHKAAAS